jgi:hypothetical protein
MLIVSVACTMLPSVTLAKLARPLIGARMLAYSICRRALSIAASSARTRDLSCWT